MEIIATLKEVSPLVTRSYTDKTGENKTISIKGFTFRHGRDTFYAEAYEDLARQLDGDKHETGDAYVMNVEMNARTWPTKDGEQRVETRLTLRSLNWFFSPRAELDPNR